ncbi:MAG: biotin/lipoate A/B protein ligase family protein [Nanoarchaeota archaeon]
MNWRLLPFQAASAAMNMAIDEAILESIAEGKSPPTIRFYAWRPSAVSIGVFQEAAKEVRLDVCRAKGVDVVRRITGGGAVYHDADGEITYSILAPESMFPKGITESYHLICGWIVDGLAKVGIEGQFHPINDVIAGDKKISGNAQTRRKKVLLQHGTILYDLDVDTMFDVLDVGPIKIKDKVITNVKQRVTSVRDLAPGVSKDEVLDAMRWAFLAEKRWSKAPLSDDERIVAERLARQKYGSKDWLMRR